MTDTEKTDGMPDEVKVARHGLYGVCDMLENCLHEIKHHDSVLQAKDAEIERLRKAAKAFQELNACYRLGRQPSERLFKELEIAREALNQKGD